MTNQARPWSVDQVLDVKQKLTDHQNPYKGSLQRRQLLLRGASAITSMASFAFAGRSGMKAARGTCFVAGTPVVAVSSHVAQVQLAAEPAGGSGRPGWSVGYVGIFAGLTASAAARGAARRQRRRRREVLEREAREAVFGEVERQRDTRSGILAESLLEDVRWFEQDIREGPDKRFDVVFGRGQWAAAVREAVSGMDDFLDGSTQRGTDAAKPVAGTPAVARPAVRAAPGPCVLAGTEYASERTLPFPAGAEEASRTAAPPSPRSGHNHVAPLAGGTPRRQPNARSKRPAASRCRPWVWNAASILSLAVALVCLALIPPFGGKLAADPEPSRLTAATNAPSLPTIPIERIRPGDWALAHNPELTDEERWAADRDEFGPVEAPDDWRLISLRMEKPDGGDLQIELLRPVDWLHWYEVRVGAEIDLDLEELGADGPATVLAIHRCPQILPRPDPGYQLVTGRFAHSSAEVLDLVLIDAHREPTAIGVTASHPFWSADQQAFVPAGDLTPGTRLQTATGDPIQLATLTPRPGREPVFNIEVGVEHVYYVGDAGLLAHNVCAKRTIPRDAKGRFAKGAGGHNVHAARGIRAYKNYRDALGARYSYEVRLRSGRADAVDWNRRIIRELKPANSRAIARGNRQLERYRKELEKMTGQKWHTYLDTYNP